MSSTGEQLVVNPVHQEGGRKPGKMGDPPHAAMETIYLNPNSKSVATVESGNGKDPSFHPYIPEIVQCTGLGFFLVFVGICVVFAFPVATIVLGAVFFDDSYCPIEHRTSTLLIVGGALDLFDIFIKGALYVNSRRKRPSWPLYEAVVRIITNVTYIVWILVASVLIFRVWPTVNFNAKGSPKYCDKPLYLYSFSYLIISWIRLALWFLSHLCEVVFFVPMNDDV